MKPSTVAFLVIEKTKWPAGVEVTDQAFLKKIVAAHDYRRDLAHTGKIHYYGSLNQRDVAVIFFTGTKTELQDYISHDPFSANIDREITPLYNAVEHTEVFKKAFGLSTGSDSHKATPVSATDEKVKISALTPDLKEVLADTYCNY